MRMRRTPFYGDAEDAVLLGAFGADVAPEGTELVSSEGERMHVSAVDRETGTAIVSAGPAPAKELHPNCREMGTEIALGFVPHDGENRRQRLGAVARWNPKDHQQAEPVGGGAGESGTSPDAEPAPAPLLPTRRELLKQRQRQRRGKLDPELRRLQRRKLNG